MACPTTILPFKISATSLCTVFTSSPAGRRTWMRNYGIEKINFEEVNSFRISLDSHQLSWLTISDVFGSDAADGCPVVCHLFCGFHMFVVDAFPKLIHERDASQDAVLSIRTDSHHLTVDGHGSGEANVWWTAEWREDSSDYYVSFPDEFDLGKCIICVFRFITKNCSFCFYFCLLL